MPIIELTREWDDRRRAMAVPGSYYDPEHRAWLLDTDTADEHARWALLRLFPDAAADVLPTERRASAPRQPPERAARTEPHANQPTAKAGVSSQPDHARPGDLVCLLHAVTDLDVELAAGTCGTVAQVEGGEAWVRFGHGVSAAVPVGTLEVLDDDLERRYRRELQGEIAERHDYVLVYEQQTYGFFATMEGAARIARDRARERGLEAEIAVGLLDPPSLRSRLAGHHPRYRVSVAFSTDSLLTAVRYHNDFFCFDFEQNHPVPDPQSRSRVSFTRDGGEDLNSEDLKEALRWA